MPSTPTTSLVTLAVLTAAAALPGRQRNGIAIPISKRTNMFNIDKSVNFDALSSHTASVEAKVSRGLETFKRNTGMAHPSAVKGTRKRDAGVPLTSDPDHGLWYGDISVGTPPKTFTVEFHTGSSDLFLPASTCGSNCDGHTLWDPESSSTSKDLDKTFSLLYGNGANVSGKQYTDTVSVAGFTACEQTLGAAEKYSSGFNTSHFSPDGLMGMGFQSLSQFNASTFFESLVSEGQVNDASFSFKLTSSGSELYIGGSNSDLYTGDFSYTPVTQQGFWQVTMDDVQFDGQTILSNVDSVIDTGTPFIYGPSSDVSKLYDAVGGKLLPNSGTPGLDIYTFDCYPFPEISFTFGGTSFPIPPSVLNIGAVSHNSSQCVSGIVGKNDGTSFWVIGDTFLQNVYTVFDYGNSRVGFADLA